MNNNSTGTNTVRRLTLSAVLLSMAVLVNYAIDIIIPIGGAPVLAIRFGGPFINFIALLFGGLYGGIAGALKDLIGFFLKPKGAYLWPFTVVEFAKAFSIGFLWVALKRVNIKRFNAVYIFIFALVFIIGAVNFISINAAPDSSYTLFLMQIGENYFASIGLILSGAAGLFALLPAYFVSKKYGGSIYFEMFLKLFITIAVPCLIFTTVNTVILQKFVTLSDEAFIYLWIPRFIEEIIQVLLNTYILFIFYRVYSRISGNTAV